MISNRKVALVTGSTKGIGKAIAEHLLQEHYFVIINYSSDENAANDIRQEWHKYSNSFILVKANLSNYKDAKMLLDVVYANVDSIDCLVLNCGTTDRTPFDRIEIENWESVLRMNISIPFFLVQQLSPILRNDSGRIIFIGSILGIFPHAISLSYGITKAAIHQMAKELVKVFADRRITVNAIAPGFIDTSWHENKTEAQRKRIEMKTATGRLGKPEEIAELCWCVINNAFINGAVLNIDGGYCYK